MATRRVKSESDLQAKMVRAFVWLLIILIVATVVSMEAFPDFWDPIFAWVAQTGAH